MLCLQSAFFAGDLISADEAFAPTLAFARLGACVMMWSLPEPHKGPLLLGISLKLLRARQFSSWSVQDEVIGRGCSPVLHCFHVFTPTS